MKEQIQKLKKDLETKKTTTEQLLLENNKKELKLLKNLPKLVIDLEKKK